MKDEKFFIIFKKNFFKTIKKFFSQNSEWSVKCKSFSVYSSAIAKKNAKYKKIVSFSRINEWHILQLKLIYHREANLRLIISHRITCWLRLTVLTINALIQNTKSFISQRSSSNSSLSLSLISTTLRINEAAKLNGKWWLHINFITFITLQTLQIKLYICWQT